MKTLNMHHSKLFYLLLSFSCFLVFTRCKKKDTALDLNYSNFRILSVKVVSLAFKDEFNKDWDSLDEPDVYFNIETINNTIKYNGSVGYKNNITPSNLPLQWDIKDGFLINNFSETNYIILYDKDTEDPNDRMGFVTFTMTAHKSGYPKTISKSNNGITITIQGEWF